MTSRPYLTWLAKAAAACVFIWICFATIASVIGIVSMRKEARESRSRIAKADTEILASACRQMIADRSKYAKEWKHYTWDNQVYWGTEIGPISDTVPAAIRDQKPRSIAIATNMIVVRTARARVGFSLFLGDINVSDTMRTTNGLYIWP